MFYSSNSSVVFLLKKRGTFFSALQIKSKTFTYLAVFEVMQNRRDLQYYKPLATASIKDHPRPEFYPKIPQLPKIPGLENVPRQSPPNECIAVEPGV